MTIGIRNDELCPGSSLSLKWTLEQFVRLRVRGECGRFSLRRRILKDPLRNRLITSYMKV